MDEGTAIPGDHFHQSGQLLAQIQLLMTQLRTALRSRSTIDQATGILMSRVGCGPEEALDRLRDMSQRENQKLHRVAQRHLDEAILRARARHPRP